MQAPEAISSPTMRFISENIQFSRMKNSIFPQSSSQHYGFGFSEAVPAAPLQIDSKFLYMDSKAHNHQNVQIGGVYAQSSTVSYQPGPSSVMAIKRLDCPPPFGANAFTNNKDTVPATYDRNVKQQQRSHVERAPAEPNNELGAVRNPRKRPIENADTTSKRIPESAVAGNRASSQGDHHQWTTNKKMAMSFQVQERVQMLDRQPQKEVPDKAPPRRSQKLADKITALQKLVSPYGKTDTASVLHEASIFIKVLQEQIQISLHGIRSTSMGGEYPQSKTKGERQFDLRGNGFGLGPVSLIKNLIKEDPYPHFSTTNFMLQPNSLTRL